MKRWTFPESAWSDNPLLAPPADRGFVGPEDGAINHDHYVYGGPRKWVKRRGQWVEAPPLPEDYYSNPARAAAHDRKIEEGTVTAQVLLDASFWIALRDAREPWHSQARQAAENLLRHHTRLVFTSFILAETHAYFSRSTGHAQPDPGRCSKEPGPALGAGLAQ